MRTLLLSLVFLASAPAAAQSGCVRDSSGALNCTSTRFSDPRIGLGATRMPRHVLTPEVAARADARTQAILDDHEDQRRQSDALVTHQRLSGCIGALMAAGTPRARAEQRCDR